jgi:hypothetical protein
MKNRFMLVASGLIDIVWYITSLSTYIKIQEANIWCGRYQLDDETVGVQDIDADDEFYDSEPLPVLGRCRALYTFEGN